jgi:class 3 adenylate cyclase
MSDEAGSPSASSEDAGKSTLARLRHDLRTPLNQIIGYSELLIETVDEHDIAEVVAPLEEIHQAGTDMLGKLNDELAPWKVQSGQVSLPNLQQQLIEPLRIIDDACDRCSRIAGRHGAVDMVDDLGKIREAVNNLRRGLNVTIEDEPPRQQSGLTMAPMDPPAPVAVRADETGKLLVVDDDHLNREMIARRLEHMGFKVVLAADGLEALAALKREAFDLVLLDVLMPELDGFQTLERIKAHEHWRSIPVVMLSALDDADSTARCLTTGAEDYVPKPFNPVVLRARINASLEKKRLRDQEQRYLERIKQEQAKAEQLLLTILPAVIADRLKSGERNIVDEVPAATVMFIDIVGFTSIAKQTEPDTTVALLNSLFSAFDSLVEVHGLEKIKTIGDAYMAVAGVPNPVEDHALRAARMALAVQKSLAIFNRSKGVDWSVRMGIHSGPLMAGIIGSRKFAYDLWGDTVNLASRLESQGEAGRIQISEETARLIEPEFTVSPVGVVDIRNRGEIPVFKLDGSKLGLR